MMIFGKPSKNCINLISKITSFDVGSTSKHFRNPISKCGIQITADSNDKYKSSADNLIYILDFVFQLIRCPKERKKEKVPQEKIFRKYQGNSDYIEIRDFKMATTCSKRWKKKRIAEKDFIFPHFILVSPALIILIIGGKLYVFKFSKQYKRYIFCSFLFFI